MTGICRIIVAFSFAIVACKGRNKDLSVSITEKEREINKVQLKDLNEQPIDLQKYKGKTIFINFWATWCKPCIEEMPSIEKAQDILRNENVIFLLASAESADEIKAFRNASNYKFNFVRIYNSEELDIQALPTTFIFNPDGELVFLEQGYRKWDEENNIVMMRNIASGVSNLNLLPSPADSLSAEPHLFSDKNGLVYLSWIEKRKEKSWLKFSVLNNNQWSEPSVISSGNNWFVNWADYPQIAADGAQNLAAHFLEKSDKGTYTYDIKLVTSGDQGRTWSKPRILHDDGKKAEHGFVSIVPYGTNYFISWLDGRNAAVEGGEGHHGGHHGQMTIRGAIVDKTGKKLNEWELDNRVCDCCQTGAAITVNGPVVVYRDRSDNEIRDISIVRFINGKWTEPKPIFADNWKIEGCPVNGPRIAAEGNNVAVAWFSSPEKKAQVNVAFSEDGGATFSNPVRVDDGKALGRVDIVLLDGKSAMVSWMEGSAIKTAKVYATGKKDPSILIASSSESRSSGFPQMTRSGNEIIFAWTDDKEKRIKVASLLADSLTPR